MDKWLRVGGEGLLIFWKIIVDCSRNYSINEALKININKCKYLDNAYPKIIFPVLPILSERI
jgi:hypothetical protein